MQDNLLNQMRNFMQNLYDGPPGVDKKHEATTDTELSSTKDIHPLAVQEPPQNSDIRQLIREGCCAEVPEQQKQKIEDTMLELVKICQEKEFLCIHDDIDDLIESALNSKLLLINSNSQRHDKKEQEVKNVVEQPAEHEKQPEHLLSMGYEHLNITPETKSNEVIESNAENLLPIPSECEVADDDISVYDDDFENIEYVEALFSDPEIVSVEEENVVQQEEEEVDFEDISQIQDVVLREKLLSITRLISKIKSLNDNSTLDRVLNSFEFDNSLLDNFSPEFKTFCDHSEETRSGGEIFVSTNDEVVDYFPFMFVIRILLPYLIFPEISPLFLSAESEDTIFDPEVDLFLSDNSIPPGIENFPDDPEGDIRFLEELLIDDSILSYELSDSNFEDNPSIPRPPPEPPDDKSDLEPEVILAVMEDIDEHFD
uniref:Reverse transcriptase domain-containing protein n=1 Tax=Tanacetum cinerariifolium TaxID=118510 RepID=A0A6L2LS72_TANCI|nr:hypothetical protein [Tanacetum cinerariifolium]